MNDDGCREDDCRRKKVFLFIRFEGINAEWMVNEALVIFDIHASSYKLSFCKFRKAKANYSFPPLSRSSSQTEINL